MHVLMVSYFCITLWSYCATVRVLGLNQEDRFYLRWIIKFFTFLGCITGAPIILGIHMLTGTHKISIFHRHSW
jgi:hypothetical protein